VLVPDNADRRVEKAFAAARRITDTQH
jgi:hypothetical protein